MVGSPLVFFDERSVLYVYEVRLEDVSVPLFLHPRYTTDMARNTNGTGFSLKDELFNKKKVKYLGSLFAQTDGRFDAEAFVQEVMKDMLSLELKQRIVCIAKGLEKQLPIDFEKACTCIVKALPDELDPYKTDDDFGDFIFAPLGEYVIRNGLKKEFLKTSLATLKEITKRFSMEDAIRYFINAFPEETMKELGSWTHDQNYHVRRLVSEGTRPLLPWSGRVVLEVSGPLPYLDILHADSTRYVTRSVANHINDISKKEPKVAVQTLSRWQKKGIQEKTEMDWMTRHSLRTLLKQGHTGALEMLGYHTRPKINVSDIVVNYDTVKMGESLDFSCTVTAQRDEKLMVDYVIDFVKANGQTKPKVFKLKKFELKKGESVTLKKSHRFRKDATTFTLYPGEHSVRLQINGTQMGCLRFKLK